MKHDQNKLTISIMIHYHHFVLVPIIGPKSPSDAKPEDTAKNQLATATTNILCNKHCNPPDFTKYVLICPVVLSAAA